MAEKMITIAKDDTLYAKRKVLAYVTKEDVVKKLFDEIAPKYRGVNGGYTRIVLTGPRRGDAAEMCIIELCEAEADKKAAAKAKTTAKTTKTSKTPAKETKKAAADTKTDEKPAKAAKTPAKAAAKPAAKTPAKATKTATAEKAAKPAKAKAAKKETAE
jgi:hypothetical protein